MKPLFSRLASLYAFVCLLSLQPAHAAAPATIAWQPWSDGVFAQAKREHKFVLIDLQAVWCHWCHVMDTTTYSDPRVIALIRSRYIAVRVDQDSRPDLAQRYQDYGWPATVVFNADAGEIVKRAGYLPPEEMRSMLQAIIDDPTPGPSVVNARHPTSAMARPPRRSKASRNSCGTATTRSSAVGAPCKNFSTGTTSSTASSPPAPVMPRATARPVRRCRRNSKLVDPVWGGVDQYSAEGDWDHPHFEKIMQFQAENMRIYAEACAQWKRPVYLKTAEASLIMCGIFSPVQTARFTPAKDADLVPGVHSAQYFRQDDIGRRRLGLPRVDKHIYARENGWFIEALATLAAVTGDNDRDDALHAAKDIIANRSLPGGGFQHGEADNGPASLGDTLAMGRAFLKLYELTADHAWLTRASQAASFIDTHFAYRTHGMIVGYTPVTSAPGAPFAPVPDFDENVSLARFANLLSYYTGTPHEHESAENALRFAAAPEVAQSRLSAVGGLLPSHAKRKSTGNRSMWRSLAERPTPRPGIFFLAAIRYPVIYKQVEWIDRSSGDTRRRNVSRPSARGSLYMYQRGVLLPFFFAG